MLVMFAAAVVGLGFRPTEISGPDAAGYSKWLAEKTIELDGQITGKVCNTAIVTSIDRGNAGPPLFKAPPPDEFTSVSSLEHLRIEQCEHVRKPNILTFRVKSGGWRAFALLDGDSHADLRLQIDAMRSARAHLMLGADCMKDGTIPNAVIGAVKILKERSADGSWSELWPATVCGKQVAVEVEFSPDRVRGGTGIVVHRVAPDGSSLPPESATGAR